MSAAAVGTAVRPNLFVVGGPKAGTTALWRHLDHHPEIFMSKVKEPHYFSPGRRLADVVRDPAAYALLFAESGECRHAGEASATYLADPGAARRIHKAVGSARILVSLPRSRRTRLCELLDVCAHRH